MIKNLRLPWQGRHPRTAKIIDSSQWILLMKPASGEPDSQLDKTESWSWRNKKYYIWLVDLKPATKSKVRFPDVDPNIVLSWRKEVLLLLTFYLECEEKLWEVWAGSGHLLSPTKQMCPHQTYHSNEWHKLQLQSLFTLRLQTVNWAPTFYRQIIWRIFQQLPNGGTRRHCGVCPCSERFSPSSLKWCLLSLWRWLIEFD